MRRTDMKFGVGLLCTYSVVATYDLAKVRSRVQIPLGARLDGSATFLLHVEHEVSGSNPELGLFPISSIGRARNKSV